MTRRERPLWALAGLPALLLILLPLVVMTGRAEPGKVLESLRDADVLKAIFLSLRTTVIAVVLIVVLGLPLAYYTGRVRSRFSSFVDGVSDLPIVLPPAVAGIALLMTFGRSGWLGPALDKFGIQVTFTWIAVVLAQIFVALPYFVRSAVEGVRKVDPDEVHAAALDGANSWKVAWKIVLPQCRDALAAGTLLAWARALGEFGATLMFAGNFVGRTQTVPLAIYTGFEEDLDKAVALSIVLLVFAVVVLVAARILFRSPRR